MNHPFFDERSMGFGTQPGYGAGFGGYPSQGMGHGGYPGYGTSTQPTQQQTFGQQPGRDDYDL